MVPKPSALCSTRQPKNASKESDFLAPVLIFQTRPVTAKKEINSFSEGRRKFFSIYRFHNSYCNYIRYCGTNGPDPVTLKGKAAKKGLRVMFASDKKIVGDGAECTAVCLDGATVTTEAPTTTSGQ